MTPAEDDAAEETQAAEEFPFLKDPQSEGSKLVQQFLGSVPYTHPDARAVAATWAEGELARRARQAKAKAPALSGWKEEEEEEEA